VGPALRDAVESHGWVECAVGDGALAAGDEVGPVWRGCEASVVDGELGEGGGVELGAGFEDLPGGARVGGCRAAGGRDAKGRPGEAFEDEPGEVVCAEVEARGEDARGGE
jgi:hypothetical protein